MSREILNPDWQFQRFGTQNGKDAKVYFGSSLERMGLVMDGEHRDLTEIDTTNGDGSITKVNVKPIVWPLNARPEEPKITLFVPVVEKA